MNGTSPPPPVSVSAIRHACITHVIDNRSSSGDDAAAGAGAAVPSALCAVVAVWNYLFSTLSNRESEPLTVSRAMEILKLSPAAQPPVRATKPNATAAAAAAANAPAAAAAPATPATELVGNQTVLRWFLSLCAHLKVSGTAHYWFKARGVGRTVGATEWTSDTVRELHTGLNPPPPTPQQPQSSGTVSSVAGNSSSGGANNTAFILHCDDEFVVPLASALVAPPQQLPAPLPLTQLSHAFHSHSHAAHSSATNNALTTASAASTLSSRRQTLTNLSAGGSQSIAPIKSLHSLSGSNLSGLVTSRRSSASLSTLAAASTSAATATTITVTPPAPAAGLASPPPTAGGGVKRSSSALALAALLLQQQHSASHNHPSAPSAVATVVPPPGGGVSTLGLTLAADVPPLTLPLAVPTLTAATANANAAALTSRAMPHSPAAVGGGGTSQQSRLSPAASTVTLSSGLVRPLSPSASLMGLPSIVSSIAAGSGVAVSGQFWVYAFSNRLSVQLREAAEAAEYEQEMRLYEQLTLLRAQQQQQQQQQQSISGDGGGGGDFESELDADSKYESNVQPPAIELQSTPSPPPQPPGRTLPPPLCAVTSEVLGSILTHPTHNPVNCVLAFYRLTDKPKSERGLNARSGRQRRSRRRLDDDDSDGDGDGDGSGDDDSDDESDSKRSRRRSGGGRRRRNGSSGGLAGGGGSRRSNRTSLSRIHETADGADGERERGDTKSQRRANAGSDDKHDDSNSGGGGGGDWEGDHVAYHPHAASGSAASSAASKQSANLRAPTAGHVTSSRFARHSTFVGDSSADDAFDELDDAEAHSAGRALDHISRNRF